MSARIVWLVALLALAGLGLSVLRLEQARSGLISAPLDGTGGIPATITLRPDTGPAPVVVIAHGFAGSQALMHSQALTLAQAGYVAVTFDFMGHGRNPAPMTGDVTSVDGTTRLMMAEVERVAEAALAHPASDGQLALLGHSMASDIIIRAAAELPRTKAVVALSMASQAVTPDTPRNLLALTGGWETGLIPEARRVLALADPAAEPGQTTGNPADGSGRRVVLVPGVEHVGILYSRVALAETVAWLDQSFERSSNAVAPPARGGWIVLLLASITLLAWPLARALPAGVPAVSGPLPQRWFWLATLAPALAVPLLLAPFHIRLLPVLVADYLAVHLAAYGAVTLAILGLAGRLRGLLSRRGIGLGLGIGALAILAYGLAIDRYLTSFVPHAGRATIIAGLALGTIPFLLGDSVLTEAGRAAWWRPAVARGALLASLMLAVALDFDGLMFLLIILPVILLFFALFGTMAGWIGRRTGKPVVAGLGLGLMLAWTLGVTFPVFLAPV